MWGNTKSDRAATYVAKRVTLQEIILCNKAERDRTPAPSPESHRDEVKGTGHCGQAVCSLFVPGKQDPADPLLVRARERPQPQLSSLYSRNCHPNVVYRTCSKAGYRTCGLEAVSRHSSRSCEMSPLHKHFRTPVDERPRLTFRNIKFIAILE